MDRVVNPKSEIRNPKSEIPMHISRITAKSILTRSRIPGVDYSVNPYVGCQHGCRYCYAEFMKKYTGHTEAWGTFVDVKENAPQLLDRQLRKARMGLVTLSSVCDPYQPVEKAYEITRRCLEVLLRYSFPCSVLTKSPLVLRDMDLLTQLEHGEVGLTVTTDDEDIRRIFEPHAPLIDQRIDALEQLHKHGVKTYAFIGPMLPMNAERLGSALIGKVDGVLLDRMNYPSKTANLYRQHHLEYALRSEYFQSVRETLEHLFEKHGIAVR